MKSRSAPLGLGMLLALALVGAPIGCRAVPRAEPTAPSTFGQLVGATLALGDFDLACERLEQARRQYPLDAGLRRWSAVVDALRWHGDEACRTLVDLLRDGTLPASERPEIAGLLGDLLFELGRYAEAVPYLADAPPGGRRDALLQVAELLPERRRELPDFGVELPLLDRPLPTLECRVGSRLLPFVLDTGASLTVIAASQAPALQVDGLRAPLAAADGAGHGFEAYLSSVPGFSLGTLDLGSIPVLVVEDRHLSLPDATGAAQATATGLIGQDVFTALRTTFDPKRRSVVFERPRGLPESESIVCLRSEGRLLVPVRLEGVDLWFSLDTGASHSSLTPKGLARLPAGDARTELAYERVFGAAGSELTLRQVAGLALELGPVRFPGVTLPVIRRLPSRLMPVHGVLGADLLLRCRATLDSGRLKVEPPDPR